MKDRMIAVGLGMLIGSAATLSAVLWLRSGLHQAAAEGGGAAAPSSNGDVNGDGKIDISDGVYVLSWLFTGGPAPKPIQCAPGGGGALAATGQTKCYDDLGTEIDCGSPAFPGQDGQYRIGCPMEGRFADNGDGTITDACTGLMWQQDTAPGTYSWQGALVYCDDLELAAYDDWRLPNVRELQSIADYGRAQPCADPVFGAEPAPYWTSTTFESIPTNAWSVIFYDGDVYAMLIGKTSSFQLRAVRSAQ